MIERTLTQTAFHPNWRQMRFIAGPRQSGKTTLAKAFLEARGDALFYYNWDSREIKTHHNKGVDFLKRDLLLARSGQKLHWACFDEIHKMPKWRDILKSYFDEHETRARLIVTGSARLDLFRRSGDSLAGRYFLFHLFPLSLFELTRKKDEILKPFSSAEEFVKDRLSRTTEAHQTSMHSLIACGGFPEPFLKADSKFHRLWQQNYIDRLVKEDLRDLTRIVDLEKIAALITLLPQRIGNPLSINSLRGDLEASHETVRNYLRALKLCYILFELQAYTRRINRALKKEKKVYFFDWTRIEDAGRRFENYVAAELFGWVNLWRDSGAGNFEIRYVKTRSGQECDFLILKDNEPWLMIEAKLKDASLASYFYHFSERFGKVPIVQLVQEKGVLHVGRDKDYRVSASRFLSA